MIDIQDLLNKLPNISFTELTPEEQQAATEIMRPQPGAAFSQAQVYLMANFYLVVPTERLAELEELNRHLQNIKYVLNKRQ